ncbi:TetR/AcrR family transcriptional regulator [Pseudonocardia nigra]|uniref:TetR/AcrR family transcriptional regulator n=1 Tax=Pseudonocardia nigra TaxID=1921578 RepID=UPI001C5FBBD7|nr:TetR/AcrR family transcriptional regulator [Pseudonocardia nigra]
MAPAKRSAHAANALRASLVEHAARLVRREGAGALTMRALAAEAGCAVGLPYKVFGSREELVATLVDEQFRQLTAALDDIVAVAGTRTVAENLGRFAEVLLGAETEVIKLAGNVQDTRMAEQVEKSAHGTAFVDALTTTVARYLTAEKRLGRIGDTVDVDAVEFLVTGAIHNQLVSGTAYPRPDLVEISRYLSWFARVLA